MKINERKIIEEFVQAKFEIFVAEKVVTRLKTDFYIACEKHALSIADDKNRIVDLSECKSIESIACIREGLSRGEWAYSKEINALEDELKLKKKQWQETHLPTGGRDKIWVVEIFKRKETL